MSHSILLSETLKALKVAISQQIPAKEITHAKHRHTIDNLIQGQQWYIAIGQLSTLKPIYICPRSSAYLGIAANNMRNIVPADYQNLLLTDNWIIIPTAIKHFKNHPEEIHSQVFTVKRYDNTWRQIYAIATCLYDEHPHNGDIVILLISDINEQYEKDVDAHGNAVRHHLSNKEFEQFLLLTLREKEVLKWIGLEKTNKEIAGILNISVYTVETHRKNLLTKLQVNSAAGLAVWATKAGLLK